MIGIVLVAGPHPGNNAGAVEIKYHVRFSYSRVYPDGPVVAMDGHQFIGGIALEGKIVHVKIILCKAQAAQFTGTVVGHQYYAGIHLGRVRRIQGTAVVHIGNGPGAAAGIIFGQCGKGKGIHVHGISSGIILAAAAGIGNRGTQQQDEQEAKRDGAYDHGFGIKG